MKVPWRVGGSGAVAVGGWSRSSLTPPLSFALRSVTHHGIFITNLGGARRGRGGGKEEEEEGGGGRRLRRRRSEFFLKKKKKTFKNIFKNIFKKKYSRVGKSCTCGAFPGPTTGRYQCPSQALRRSYQAVGSGR